MQEVKNLSIYRQSLRDRILETAISLFMKNGIRAVKMDDIANVMSVSKRTLYDMYSDKEHLLYEGIKKDHIMRREHLKEFASKSDSVMDVILYAYKLNIEKFREANPLFFSDMEKYPDVIGYLNEEKIYSGTQFVDFLNRGIEEGYFRSDINCKLIVCLFDALGDYFKSAQLYKQYTWEEIMMNIVFVSLRGICTSKGGEILDGFLLTYNR